MLGDNNFDRFGIIVGRRGPQSHQRSNRVFAEVVAQTTDEMDDMVTCIPRVGIAPGSATWAIHHWPAGAEGRDDPFKLRGTKGNIGAVVETSTCAMPQMPEQLGFDQGSLKPRHSLLKIDDKANRIPIAPSLIVGQPYVTSGGAA
ncbi:hypothetical protein AW926_09250 [Pseudomonas aeruginosa]|nr:hypothetical protein AW926_09250 [Pseudomonas aeruginosa]